MKGVKSLVASMVTRHVVTSHDGMEVTEGEDLMNHILLLGPPGSGKSTISELLSGIICAIGVLRIPTAEVLKELEENDKKDSSNAHAHSSGDEGRNFSPLTLGTSGGVWSEIHELKEKNSSLMIRLNSINSISRSIHDDTASLGTTTSELELQLGDLPPPLLPRISATSDLVSNLQHLRQVLSEVREKMDRLLVISHVNETFNNKSLPEIEVTEPPAQETESIVPEPEFNPRYIQGTRADLIGRFVGQTAPKVRALVLKAMGGVLFIDEAYALVNRTSTDEPESFSMECINTLCGLMSRYGRYFVCIMAGYHRETIKAMTINQGISRRLTHVIILGKYSPEEIEKIFRQQLLRLGLTPIQSLDLLSFIRTNHQTFGTTGAISNQLASACASYHSVRRFREICEGKTQEEKKGEIDLEILEKSLQRVKINLKSMEHEDSSSPPLQMYV